MIQSIVIEATAYVIGSFSAGYTIKVAVKTLTPNEELFLDYLIDSAIDCIQKENLQNSNKSPNLKVQHG